MYYPARAGTYTLNSSIGAADTTLTLTSFADPVTGIAITMATLNTSIVFATIGPKTSQSELISFTGITQNADGTATITGITRGLQFQYPFTASASYQLPHSGQSIFILSDAPQVFDEYSVIQNNEVITGQKQFPAGGNANAPTSGSSYTAPTADLEYASKKYVDTTAVAGAPNATTTVKGIVQEATVTQVNNGSPTGSTGATLFASPADLAASNYGLNLPTSSQKAALVGNSGSPGASNTYVDQAGFQNEAEVFGTTTGCSTTNAYALTLSPAVPAYQDGQRFVFKASFATTGSPNTATLNVNSLGAGNIIKAGSPNQNLLTNDIVTNQIVEVVRGSPNFQMISPLGNPPSHLIAASGVNAGTTIPGTTTFTTFLSVIIPANTLGASGTVVLRARISTSLADGSSTALPFKIFYGGNALSTFTATGTSLGNTYEGWLEIILQANGATNAQNIMGSLIAQVYTAGQFTAAGLINGTTATDSTVDQNLLIQTESTNGTPTINIRGYTVLKF